MIAALFLKQFLVGSAFDDMTLVHNDYRVRIADGGKPVCDDETGPVLHKSDHGILDMLLGSGIHAGRRFVKYQDLRI